MEIQNFDLSCYRSYNGTTYQIVYVWRQGTATCEVVGKKGNRTIFVNTSRMSPDEAVMQKVLDKLADNNGWVWCRTNEEIPVVNCLHGGEPKWDC